ncbi:hypothetical protein Sp245p_26440 (plasmid) [Azospirillum baldaniorum]|nr:hypothetical protein Sp245p_26440 [Azospirillum baldaniorum]
MTLHCAAVSAGHQGQARVDVLIDDVVVTSRTMSHMDAQAVPVELPSGTGRAGSLMKVSLVTDSALVPQDVGLGSDFRCLGVLLVGIEWHQPAAAAQHNGVHHNGTQPKAESGAGLEVLSEIRSEANGEASEKDGMMAASLAKKPRAADWKAAPSSAKQPSSRRPARRPEGRESKGAAAAFFCANGCGGRGRLRRRSTAGSEESWATVFQLTKCQQCVGGMGRRSGCRMATGCGQGMEEKDARRAFLPVCR